MKKNLPSIYWHDYETFGANAKTDRPVQFAGIRTDLDLNIIGDPLEIYSKPSNDFFPEPDACMVTGITPQHALEHGIPETEFMQAILKEFSQSNTCVAGYNSIRFDDEFTRYSLYRNLFDPYGREWQNGNSRWDIIDLVRVTYALRPDGLNWPTHPDGSPSFRLEQLTEANNIQHSAAHDALSDVTATIDIAKLIKQKQPRLYDYYFNLRSKHAVLKLLDIKNHKPVLHVSSMFSTEYCCTALVVPLIQHPTNKNAIIAYDLRQNPDDLIKLSADQIRSRLYTKTEDLKAGEQRIALKSIHINKCPVIVPAKIDAFTEKRLHIDKTACQQHLQKIRESTDLLGKMTEVFSVNEFEPEKDPDLNLYGGAFFSDRDKKQMDQIHNLEPFVLANKVFNFTDSRLDEMLFRYRARNYPESLSATEQQQWQQYRLNRLTNSQNSWITETQYFHRIDELLQQQPLKNKTEELLNNLIDYGKSILQQ